MGPGGRGTALILVTLLGLSLLPPAQAAPATGQFTTEGSLQLPEASHAKLSGTVVLLDDSSTLERFQLEADAIEVCEYGRSGVSLLVPAGGAYGTTYNPTEACFPLENARLDLAAGDHAGWAGLRVDPAGDLQFFSAESFRLNHRTHSRLADATSSTSTGKSPDEPSDPKFVQDVDDPHLLTEARGMLTYAGKGELKIYGPDFQIVSATNTTTYQTGETWTSDPVAQGTLSWVVLHFTNARVGITSLAAPFQIATSQAQAATDGRLEFQAASGTLDVDGITYPAAEGFPVQLEGQFETRLAPAPTSLGITLALVGDVRSLNVDGTRFTPPQAANSSFPWLTLLVGMVAVGAGGMLLHWRLRPRAPFGMMEYWTFGGQAMQNGNYEEALTWIRRARELSPRVAALAADEAKCLYNLGDVPGALKRLEEAHRLAKEGDYALVAARFMREHSYPLEAVEERLVAALDKSPMLLFEAEAEFPEMTARPNWATVAYVTRLRFR